MRVLLVATNRYDRVNNRMNAQPMPIGLAYIAGHLDHDRHQVKVVDLMFADDYLAEIEQTVREFQPHVVGISLAESQQSQLPEHPMGVAHHQGRHRPYPASTAMPPSSWAGRPSACLPKQCFEFPEAGPGRGRGRRGDLRGSMRPHRNRRTSGLRPAWAWSTLRTAGVALNEGAVRLGLRQPPPPGRFGDGQVPQRRVRHRRADQAGQLLLPHTRVHRRYDRSGLPGNPPHRRSSGRGQGSCGRSTSFARFSSWTTASTSRWTTPSRCAAPSSRPTSACAGTPAWRPSTATRSWCA